MLIPLINESFIWCEKNLVVWECCFYMVILKSFFLHKKKKTDLGKFIPLSVNPTKCSDKLKQFVGCDWPICGVGAERVIILLFKDSKSFSKIVSQDAVF